MVDSLRSMMEKIDSSAYEILDFTVLWITKPQLSQMIPIAPSML